MSWYQETSMYNNWIGDRHTDIKKERERIRPEQKGPNWTKISIMLPE